MDLASDSFISAWPAWVRWVIFIPAALLCGIVANIAWFLFTWVGGMMAYGYYTTDGWWYILASSVLFSIVFVYVGAYVAPSNQFIVAVIMTSIIAALVGASVLGMFMGYEGENGLIPTIIGLIGNMGGAIGVLVNLKDKLS